MQRVRTTLFLAFALVNSGCLSTILGTKENKSKDYHMPAPGRGWDTIDPAEADAAYRNEKDNAILNISSTCGEERFRSLEELTKVVLRQLPDNTVSAPSRPMTIGGHPGLVTDAKGTVDGEDLDVRVAVVRSPKCIYDIILAGRKLDSSSQLAFDTALAGFSEGSKR
ncbi:MAG: hypothetical protein EOP07_19465 [Proteobacteria bacterium]|nr:MAG: hypothetical protein EOP07_19465 [Pseudomonadota bacterium]